jgi:DNA-binding response OmpR family regulator
MQAATRAATTTILLAEDVGVDGTETAEVLERAGYRVRRVRGPGGVQEQYLEVRPDLIIMDLARPDADWLLLCADLRGRYDASIIICSAESQARDRALALKLGVDDFITRPYDEVEFEARVQAVLRRVQRKETLQMGPMPGEELRIGGLAIDHTRRRVRLDGTPLQLTPTEYRLLRTLASRPDDVFTREELARRVWGYLDASNSRTIDVHIRRLRAKLAAAGAGPTAPSIASVRGFGYKLVPPEREVGAAA